MGTNRRHIYRWRALSPLVLSFSYIWCVASRLFEWFPWSAIWSSSFSAGRWSEPTLSAVLLETPFSFNASSRDLTRVGCFFKLPIADRVVYCDWVKIWKLGISDDRLTFLVPNDTPFIVVCSHVTMHLFQFRELSRPLVSCALKGINVSTFSMTSQLGDTPGRRISFVSHWKPWDEQYNTLIYSRTLLCGWARLPWAWTLWVVWEGCGCQNVIRHRTPISPFSQQTIDRRGYEVEPTMFSASSRAFA